VSDGRSASEILADAAAAIERRSGDRRTDAPKTACPACGCRHSRVYDSRDLAAYGPSYWRRRICAGCGEHYRTEEISRSVIARKKSA
jgi:ribosomal protein L32